MYNSEFNLTTVSKNLLTEKLVINTGSRINASLLKQKCETRVVRVSAIY